MDAKTIENRLKAFLYDESLKEEIASLTNDDSLLERGIIDSVKMMELVEFIEQQFGIHVDEEDLIPENFDSINAIVGYIQERHQS